MSGIYPFVSVIMPIRNEADFIDHSLGAVLAQDYPHERMEVLIADGMSSDDTRSVIAELTACSTEIPVSIIDNPRRIVSTGFNLAFTRSRGDVIVRVDGHCEIARDYVSKCVDHLRRENIGGVGGPVDTIGTSMMSELIAIVMSSRFGVGDSSFRTEKTRTLYVDTIAFPAYPRHVIERAGLLDEELVRNQDDEYNYRLRKLGYKLLLAADVHSKYYSRNSIPQLWRQYYQYGLYKVRVMQKHPGQMRPRQFVPAALITALVCGFFLAIISPFVRELWLLTCAAYVSANLTASIITARKKHMKQGRFLPVVFATIHFSYGMGFVSGLIRFYVPRLCIAR